MLTPVQLAVDIGTEFKLKKDVAIGDSSSGYGSIGEFLSAILPNIYVVASLILFILLIAGGFAIIAAGDNPQQKGKGAKAVTSAVIGFIIIFASFWIIKLIEFITGVEIFSPNI